MKIDLASGQTIAFDHYGDPTADAVVLLHGLSSNRGAYHQVVSHLSAGPIGSGSLQVFAVDMRGHGDSGRASPDSYDAGSYAGDIAEFIRSVVGKPALVVGHSLGGVVSAMLAATHPETVRGLFLEDPPYFEGDAAVRNASPVAAIFPGVVAGVLALQARNAPAADYVPFVPPMPAQDEIAGRAADMMRWDPMTMQAAVDGDVWRNFDPVAAVSCPLTILRADPAFGAVFKPDDEQLVRAANPHADITLIPGAGHRIREGVTAAAYLDHLDRFLAANHR